MSEKIRQFIDQLAAGETAEAKDTLENELAARSFGALDEYKKEIAQSIFGGKEETEEETSEEELLTQEEFDALSEKEQEMYLESLEQLNELSPALKKRYIMKADKSANKLDDDTWNKSPQNYTPADKIKRQKLNIRKQGMEEGLGDYIGRKLRVKTTKGKPDLKNAPRWATALGQTPQGAWHWLEKNGPIETPDSDRYFPLSGKTEFTGFHRE